jgi:hypothetical protein
MIPAFNPVLAIASIIMYEIGARHIDTELDLLNTGGFMNSTIFVCIAAFNTVLTVMTGTCVLLQSKRMCYEFRD